MLAVLCWITARSLLSCGCPGQGRRQASVLCLLYSFLGHVCNAIGALLASQLGIQVHPAGGGGGGGDGRGCGMVCLPLPCPCPWVLAGFCGSPAPGPPWSGWREPGGGCSGWCWRTTRKCWALSWGCSLPSLPSRPGSLHSPEQAKPWPWRRLWATLCSATAGVLYAAAIVTHGWQPVHVLRALPWLLVALGSAALDVALLFIACTAKSQTSQRLVPEVPDAWAPLAGEGKEDDGEAEEEEAANWVPLHVFPKPRTGPRMVATSHSLDLMIRLVQQSGHSVARLPGDAQTGPAGPVPPQPPACPPLLARCPGVSPSSSSDATSINSELEEAACPPCCPQGAVLPGHPSHPAAAPPAPFSSQWDFEDMTVQWSRPSPAAQPCSVLSPGTFRQPAAPPRHPKHPSPQPSKQ
ncbi:transmembrane protein 44 isoform X2 [Chroicocephalus ridibundus]|uniref:transmembrane protein 44 isoform X2 n=1 Tax=Chroicocephalus ridibundus TaxID=1192867 RepID=UPI002FDEAC92